MIWTVYLFFYVYYNTIGIIAVFELRVAQDWVWFCSQSEFFSWDVLLQVWIEVEEFRVGKKLADGEFASRKDVLKHFYTINKLIENFTCFFVHLL